MTEYNDKINDEIIYWQFDKVDSERVVEGNNWDNGRIVFKRFLSSNARINLHNSYMKIILELNDVAGGTLTENANIAPSFLACTTLFKNVYYRINNQIVSSITDYYPQISALKHRLYYSQGKRDTLLKDLNFGKVYFEERQKDMMKTNNGELQTESTRITGTDVSILAATGVLTGILTTFLTDIIVGDFIQVRVAPADDPVLFQVHVLTDNLTLTVRPNPPVNIVNVADFQRVRKTNKHRGKRKLELIFRPCLGIFDKSEWIIGHDFELVFFPHASPLYKKFFIQSLLTDKTPGVDYDLSITNMSFYACVGHVQKAVEVGEYDCEFMETRAQLQNITSNTALDRTFVIDKNTQYVTMCMQDQNSGNNTQFSRTLFTVRDNIHLDLQKFHLLYDTLQFPRPEHDQAFTADEDRIAQAYYENLCYSKQKKYLSDFESLKDFQTLGPYYHYKLPIRKNQSNPKVKIATTFRNSFPSGVTPKIFLMDHFKRKFKLIIKNGRCVQVIKQGIN